MMRRHRLLLVPLTVLLALGTAAPALAADVGIAVTDFEFTPRESKIAVGDRVTWTFVDGGHTTTSADGQAQSWDSNLKGAGSSFERTFAKPGRYQYICKPHRTFMKGVVEVGDDTVGDTVDAFKTKRRGTTATISFKLNEAAKVTYRLKGPSRRTVARGRLGAGRHSFKVKGLKQGSYRGTLTLEDDFDNKVTSKSSFVIR